MSKGDEVAAANGIEKWAIVVNEKVKGMGIEMSISSVDTMIFEDRNEAERWFRS